MPAPAVASCPTCHAVFLKGRWQWRAVPPGAKALMCPACHRVADHVPAAQVKIGVSVPGERFGQPRGSFVPDLESPDISRCQLTLGMIQPERQALALHSLSYLLFVA
ncbi:hypothetical protein CS8_002460 [Cupriavidus sp. 8B]